MRANREDMENRGVIPKRTGVVGRIWVRDTREGLTIFGFDYPMRRLLKAPNVQTVCQSLSVGIYQVEVDSSDNAKLTKL